MNHPHPKTTAARLTDRGKLLKIFGLAFGLAMLVGNTISVGILRTPGEVAARLPSPALFLGVWLLGGLYALLGALSMAESGAMIARSGGQYGIVHRALGAYPGFIVGWSDWLSTCASTALVAMVFAEYALPLVPMFPGGAAAIACGLVLLFGVLQWRGARSGDAAQQLLTAGKAIAFGALIVAGLVMTVPAPAAATTILPAGAALFGAVIIALQSVIFTYDGWTAPLYFGEEIADAGRAIPRSMAGGVLVVIAIYLLVNVAFIRVVGVTAMAGDPFVAATMGAKLFGENGDLIIRVVVLVSLLSGLNSNVMMAPRIPLAMSRDRLMPPAFDRVNPGGTPVIAHWTSIGLALGFILSGTVQTVLALAAFFFVANYALSFASVFALRRKEPATPRPFRVPGFPYTTGIVLLGSIAFLVGAVISDRTNSTRSLILLGASYPMYRVILKIRG